MDKARALDALRSEIDRLDREIHDRLMARARVVGEIGRLKRGFALRPGREARVLRARIARHKGRLSARTVAQLWREIISAMTHMQSPYRVGFVASSGATRDLARDHFGVLTPLLSFRSAKALIAAVGTGRVEAGVLPDVADKKSGSWWRALGSARIVARLPFVGQGDGSRAFVIARQDADASGDDATLVLLSAPWSRCRALLKHAALGGRIVASATDRLHLVELDGFVASDDASFRKLCEIAGGAKSCRRLGAFASPVVVPR